MNDPRDLPLEDRLRAHFADRAGREPLPPAESAPTERADSAPPWWRRPTLLAAAAGLLVLTGVATAVALGGDDPEDLASVGGATSSMSVPDLVGEGPTTTTSTSTTSSTTSTTAPPATGVTVVVAPDGVLGWWDGSRWIRGDSGAAPPVTGGETYTLIQLGGSGTAVGSAPATGCEFSDPRPIRVELGIAPSDDPLATPPIGLLGVADPHPRPVTELGDRAEYVQIAQELLAERGLDADGATVHAIRVDLGGNGTDEVLLRVERLSDPRTLFAGAGDFSLLVLRQVLDEQVHTTVLHESIAEGVPGVDGPTPFVEVGRVAAVADLNGDGRMEVVVQRRYYEGGSTAVWESDPAGGIHPILDVGCGV